MKTKAYFDPFEVCSCKIPDDKHNLKFNLSVVKFIKVY